MFKDTCIKDVSKTATSYHIEYNVISMNGCVVDEKPEVQRNYISCPQSRR